MKIVLYYGIMQKEKIFTCLLMAVFVSICQFFVKCLVTREWNYEG